MSSNNAVIQSGYEPISGYVLRKRLGAGGYGEVWLADAPGGLQKAIKLIYGTLEGKQASSELKSLERIRQVSHPFLLSLERIEIVDNRVVIITELAEMSLLDRYAYYRGCGSPGIPRAELIEILRDTADVLDFLVEKHSLQHLDIKPANLLLVANRVKVGDFGLVKDLKDPNQSLIGGMTPTYSAPEIFDGHPDSKSDQYSLAILFMEMLTGALPFSGKATGELARQHLHQAPNLEALPPADRPSIARALSKNPLDRFQSSRALVDQLAKVRGSVLPVLNQEQKIETTNGQVQFGLENEAGGDEQSISSGYSSTAPHDELQYRFLPRKVIASAGREWKNSRAIFVGLGGVGIAGIKEIRRQLNFDCDNRFTVEEYGWIAIDTDGKTLEDATNPHEDSALPRDATLHIPLYKPCEYQSLEPEVFGPLSRRWLYNIPKDLKTDGVRPLAILAMLDHYESLRNEFTVTLKRLVEAHKADEGCAEPLRVYLLASLHGGTGSGLLPEIALLIRRIFSQLQFSNYRLVGAATAAMTIGGDSVNLKSASALACLAELRYLQNGADLVESIYHKETKFGGASQKPLDWLTLTDGGLHGDKNDLEKTIKQLATSVRLDARSLVGAALAEDRISSAGEDAWLRTSRIGKLVGSVSVSQSSLISACCWKACQNALEFLNGSEQLISSGNSEGKYPVDHSGGNASADLSTMGTPRGGMPLSSEKLNEFRTFIFDRLNLSTPASLVTSLELKGSDAEYLSCWARRFSKSRELQDVQLQADCQVWLNTVMKLVQMGVYNWQQIKRIQLVAIEGIVDYVDNDSDQVLEVFQPLSAMFGNTEDMRRQAREYLNRLSVSCVRMFEQFRLTGKDLFRNLSSWSNTLALDFEGEKNSVDSCIDRLPIAEQIKVGKICESLGEDIGKLFCQTLESQYQTLGVLKTTGVSDSKSKIRLPQIVEVCKNQFQAIQHLDYQDRDGGDSISDAQTNIDELAEFHPPLAETGGEIHRLIVVPEDQKGFYEQAISSLELEKTTSIFVGEFSLGSHVICEAQNISLSHLITTLWRPTSKTIQLAERLHSRVDVEWPPVDDLLRVNIRFPNVDSSVLGPMSASDTAVV